MDVFSISCGGGPDYPSYAEAWDVQAMILAAQGVTLVVASGDIGVCPYEATYNTSACEYVATFPSTSPYVLSVGLTQGPQFGENEVASNLPTAGFTSGGGFSDLYPRPSWQDAVVTAYFAQVEGTNQQPLSGYNTTGRGYPDVSIVGNNFHVVINETVVISGGTSATAPSMAGLFSLVNSQRKAAGMSTLGWINPALYASNFSALVNDITVGNNKCTWADNYNFFVPYPTVYNGTCCTQGFYCTKGWDPVVRFLCFYFCFCMSLIFHVSCLFTYRLVLDHCSSINSSPSLVRIRQAPRQPLPLLPIACQIMP